jgi:regulator of protease activity HflC (stomatin/prohibitin superfamily)
VIEFIKFLFEVLEKYLMPFQVINTYERGVILTLGKNPRPVNPGLIFKIPLVQEVFTTPIMPDTISPTSVNVTTADGKTISVRVAVEFEVVDAKKWLIDVTDATTNLSDFIRSYTADYLVDVSWEEVIQKRTRTEIKNKLNKKCRLMILKGYTLNLEF